MTDYSTLTLEQLYSEKRGHIAEADAHQAEALKIVAFIDAKESKAAAEKKFAAMSDPERAALAQVIQAQGIAPAGKVGIPGN